MKILLWVSDADRERFGCGELLELDPFSVTAREAAALQQPFFPGSDGFGSPNEWRKALRGTPLTDATGAPVMVDVEETLADGTVKTTQEQKRQPDYAANAALVWLELKRAGVDVPLADLDYDQDGARFMFQSDAPVEAEGPGKDDGAEPPTTSTE